MSWPVGPKHDKVRSSASKKKVEEEEEEKNRACIQFGGATIEGWLGRDLEKKIPGLYWLTLISEALANRHNVSISSLAGAALEHSELGRGQHLFRFYDRPDEWRDSVAVAGLYAAHAGIFNLELVKPQFDLSAKTIVEFAESLRKWR